MALDICALREDGLVEKTVKNTATSSRDSRRAARRDTPPIGDEYVGPVAEELIDRLGANADEAATIAAMIDRGAHPRAVRNKVSFDRFGPRSERQRQASVVCGEHGLPFAADGLCNHGCRRSAT